MRKLLLTLLVLITVLAAAPPRPSAAVVCEIFCWTSGNQTCWQDQFCHQHCCTTGSRGCSSPCD